MKKQETPKQTPLHKDKSIWLNLLVIIVAFIAIIIFLSFILKWYTNRGESLSVPDFKGMTLKEVEEICSEKDIRFLIKDTVYAPGQPKLTVVDQNPKPLSKVKRNRRIYISINGKKAPLVSLPDIIDNQRRQAVVVLESLGLKEGKLEYTSDIALNAVIAMKHNGKVVKPGTKIEKGSTIDLVLGDGGQSPKVEVPNLVGRSLDEAMLILKGNYLNIGSILADSSVTSNNNAIIYKQRPLPNSEETIPQGESIDVWIMNPKQYEKLYGK